MDTAHLPPVSAHPLTGPSLRIAFTSNSGDSVDGHFGACDRLLVYEISAFGFVLRDIRPTFGLGHGEERTDGMLALLRDCHILVTLSIGGPAAARVTRADIHPLRVKTPESASVTLVHLQQVLATNPPPWLRKILGLTVVPAAADDEDDEEPAAQGCGCGHASAKPAADAHVCGCGGDDAGAESKHASGGCCGGKGREHRHG